MKTRHVAPPTPVQVPAPQKPVVKPPQVDKPMFIKHLQNLPVEKGKQAVFECALKTPTGSVSVNWYRNGELLRISEGFLSHFDAQSGRCALTIPEAFVDDSGQYTCTASNSAGEASSTAWLVVKGINNKNLI